VVVPFRDLDDCIRRCAANPYRLSASVFTASIKRFKACAARLPYGQVNHNRPTAGARGEMPFGGLGLSGNGRPAAVAATAIFADETVVWPSTG
jgi:acyl-CoA reductase-like NAD-dependent aldehyde dehydrogenase